jgi:hypothetical protein
MKGIYPRNSIKKPHKKMNNKCSIYLRQKKPFCRIGASCSESCSATIRKIIPTIIPVNDNCVKMSDREVN